MTYFIFKSWLIVIGIISYGLIFQTTKPRQMLFVKIIFAVAISLCISRVFYSDDISLAIGHAKEVKLPLAYCLSALTGMAYYELKFK
jgi:hypothetical protein